MIQKNDEQALIAKKKHVGKVRMLFSSFKDHIKTGSHYREEVA